MKGLNLLLITTMVLAASCGKRAGKQLQGDNNRMPDHIIIVVEENHSYDDVIGSDNAPYINQLVTEGALFTDSHGIDHPSQGNYMVLFSGGTQGVTNDKCLTDESPYNTPNLGAALINKGLTFAGFSETLPAVGSEECYAIMSEVTGAPLYARKHAPWVNWIGNKENNIPALTNVPMTMFPKDFTKLPTISFVIPNMDNDMHNIGKPGNGAAIQRADAWLKENLGAYVAWAKTHNSLLILTFDEDDFKKINHIPTLFVGANIKPGKYGEKINHYNIFHTVAAMYDLPITDTTSADIITAMWEK